MNHSSDAKLIVFCLVVIGCGANTTDPINAGSPDGATSTDFSAPLTDSSTVSSIDGGRASVPPILKAGVDPSIFLPTLVLGYHPTAEELATSSKACSTAADCATSGGQVVFHCSVPYYGQAQCQGVFPAGDQVVAGTLPSCVYYDCPVGYQCETELESHSVTCLAGQGNSTSGKPDGGTAGSGQGGDNQGGGQNGKTGGGA